MQNPFRSSSNPQVILSASGFPLGNGVRSPSPAGNGSVSPLTWARAAALATCLASAVVCWADGDAPAEPSGTEAVIRACYAKAAVALSSGNAEEFTRFLAADYIGPGGATRQAMQDGFTALLARLAEPNAVCTVETVLATEQDALAAVRLELMGFDTSLALPVEQVWHELHRWQPIDGGWTLVRASTLAGAPVTGAEGAAYSDASTGMRVPVPTGWVAFPCALTAGSQVTLVSQDLAVDLDVMATKLPQEMEPGYVALIGARAMREAIPGYELQDMAQTQLGEWPAVRTRSVYTRGGRTVQADGLLAVQGRHLYSVGVATCPAERARDYRAQTDQTTQAIQWGVPRTGPLPAPRGIVNDVRFFHEGLGLSAPIPEGWQATAGPFWSAEVVFEGVEGQARIVLGCRERPGGATAEDVLNELDGAARAQASAFRQLSIEDTGLGEIPAVQSLSEFTVGETSRKRVLTCGVTGDLQVFVVCDAVPAAAFDRLESAFREFLQRVQLRAQAQ